MKRRV